MGASNFPGAVQRCGANNVDPGNLKQNKFTPIFLNFENLYYHNHPSQKHKPGMELIVFSQSFYGVILTELER